MEKSKSVYVLPLFNMCVFVLGITFSQTQIKSSASPNQASDTKPKRTKKEINETQLKVSEADLLREQSSHEKTTASLNAIIEETNTKLENSQKENAEWAKKYRDLEDRYLSLAKKDEDKSKELELFNSESKILQETIEKLRDEKIELFEKLTELEKRHSESERRHEKAIALFKSNENIFTKEKADLMLRLTEPIKAKNILSNELKICKEINNNLEVTNSANLNKIAELEQKLKDHKNELKYELSKKDAQIRKLELNLDDVKSNYQKSKESLNHDLSGYADYDELKRDKDLLTKKYIETQAKYLDVLNDLSEAQIKSDKNGQTLNKQITQIREEKSKLESDLNQLTNKLRALESENDLLQLELREKNQVIKRLEPKANANIPSDAPGIFTLIHPSDTTGFHDNKEIDSIHTNPPAPNSNQFTLDDYFKRRVLSDGNSIF